MPRYDSLLLNCGGGIINRSQQSKQYRGAAALAIGIGGTGVAALAELKQKVYQHLEPDNPDSPVPEYQHIQFLAIDSDPTDIAMMRGMARLDREREFFSINNPNLPATLRKKDLIKSNASLNWMDIDRIGDLMLLGNLPVCPIRQVGRYLLISRASNLISTIQAKCTQALEGMTGSELDVYIFAGLSGGTGGGCFLDTCYIVQKALEDMGRAQSANVMGFFFLPDVVNSKPQVASQPAKGERADEDLSYLSDDTIWQKLRDRIYDSTVTVVFISPNMREKYRSERDQWIPWEIAFSLRETTRNDRTSHSNALIFVILPDRNNSYDYYSTMRHFNIVASNIRNGYAEVAYWSNFVTDIQGHISRALLRKQIVSPNEVVKTV